MFLSSRAAVGLAGVHAVKKSPSDDVESPPQDDF